MKNKMIKRISIFGIAFILLIILNIIFGCSHFFGTYTCKDNKQNGNIHKITFYDNTVDYYYRSYRKNTNLEDYTEHYDNGTYIIKKDNTFSIDLNKPYTTTHIYENGGQRESIFSIKIHTARSMGVTSEYYDITLISAGAVCVQVFFLVLEIVCVIFLGLSIRRYLLDKKTNEKSIDN